ncbi:MAG TPA: glycosyltransferase, partial [Anaeromyxobacteraceae bacterium]|nr:glycosyltransferase [Anaeromyxobacteraceae bacterium]
MRLLVGPGLKDPAGEEALLVKALRSHADVVTFPGGVRSFDEVLAGLPAGWEPEAVLVRDAEFYFLPPGLERSPWPVHALVGDYNLSFDRMLPILDCFDRFYCDERGVRIFRQLGFDQCEFFCLYGYDPEIHRDSGTPKDLDVVFVGNLNHAVQKERERALYQLARVGARRRVLITSGVYGTEYAKLLGRAHVVFNRSIRGEANMRFFEALGCGAVVANERLTELEHLGFKADEHYLEVGKDVEAALDRYFDEWPEERRRQLREAGRARLEGHSYSDRAQKLLEKIARTPVDIATRRARNVPATDMHRRWSRYLSSEIEVPGAGKLPRLHPALLTWQRELIQDDLEVRNFDFAMWEWWLQAMAEAGLKKPMVRFLADREALLSCTPCYSKVSEQMRQLWNTVVCGFS